MTKSVTSFQSFMLPTLVGGTIRLRPMQAEDFDGLYAAASDPEIWMLHSERDRYQLAVFRKFFDKALESPGALVVEDKSLGQIIGTTRFYDYRPQDRSVVAGYTFLTKSYWGGKTNLELKTLILDHAFQYVDLVLFHASEGNLPSRKSLTKLGAVQRPGLVEVPGAGMRVEFEMTKKHWNDLKGINVTL